MKILVGDGQGGERLVESAPTETEIAAQKDKERTREQAETMTTQEAITALLNRNAIFRLRDDPCICLLTDRILANATAAEAEIARLVRDQLAQAEKIEGLETVLVSRKEQIASYERLLGHAGLALAAHEIASV